MLRMTDAKKPLLAGQEHGGVNIPTWYTMRSAEQGVEHSVTGFEDSVTRNKLGTFMGVYLPCIMSIYNVLMYIRFTWMVGQAGIYQALLIIALAAAVSFITILSMSAICSNGAIRGGGVYFMISRTLGPELGGSTGMLFYIAGVISGNLSILGMMSPLQAHYTSLKELGGMSQTWSTFVLGSAFLAAITFIALVGAKFFAKVSTALWLLSSTAVIAGLSGFFTSSKGSLDGAFTGFSSSTWDSNFGPDYGHDKQTGEQTSFLFVFAIFYPTLTGIMAGASMSGDLADPGYSIPRGSLYATGTAILTYLAFVLFSAASVERDGPQGLKQDYFVLQKLCISPEIIVYAVILAGFQAALSGMVGSARILQAIARDKLFPGLQWFTYGTPEGDEPITAILITWFITQVFMLITEVNVLAPIITQVYLLTYAAVNLACFLLEVAGVVNFRPSFRYFNKWVTLFGFVGCLFTMFVVDWRYALASFAFFLACGLFVLSRSVPNRWGEVLQALMYLQIRKFLLKLDQSREHVKFWRPQVMLLAPNAMHCMPLVKLANSLKKGGMYAVSTVVVGGFKDVGALCEANFRAWSRALMESGIKAFATVVPAHSVLEGARGLLFSCGMGAMRPNIAMIGFPKARTAEYTLLLHQSLRKRLEQSGKPTRDDNANHTAVASGAGGLSSTASGGKATLDVPDVSSFAQSHSPNQGSILAEEVITATHHSDDEKGASFKMSRIRGTRSDSLASSDSVLPLPSCFNNEAVHDLERLFRSQGQYCGSLKGLEYMLLARDVLRTGKSLILARNCQHLDFDTIGRRRRQKTVVARLQKLGREVDVDEEEPMPVVELWLDAGHYLSGTSDVESQQFALQMAYTLTVSNDWGKGEVALRVISFGEACVPMTPDSKLDDMIIEADYTTDRNTTRVRRLKETLMELRVPCPITLVNLPAPSHLLKDESTPHSVLNELDFRQRCNLMGQTINIHSNTSDDNTFVRIVTIPELPNELGKDEEDESELLEYLDGLTLLSHDTTPTLLMRGSAPVISTDL